MSCMAALSTYMKESSTPGHLGAISLAVSRQSRDDSRIFALSTRQSLFLRFAAASKPTLRSRSISDFE